MMTKVDLSYLRDGVALLHVASHNGHLPIVQLLVERGADKDQVATQSGFTPLLHALAQKALPVAQYLLEQGADPHQAGGDGEGLTPLHLTAREGMVDQVGYFLRAPGSNVDVATTETGMTALHLASFRGHLPVVRLLLEKGADKDLGSGKVGGTAMFWAVVGRHMDVLMHLLEVAQVDPHKVRPGVLFLPAMIGVGRCSHRS
jgi:ankyrin